jgi:predicted transcriptional regulator of viral defense system
MRRWIHVPLHDDDLICETQHIATTGPLCHVPAMRWPDFLRRLGGAPVFTSAFLLAGTRSPDALRRQLDRWVRSGRILMLRRGVYTVREPYARQQLHPFVAANALQKTSYVSLHSALNYHGLIPEHVPVVTSVTTRRPEAIETPIGSFTFRHLNAGLFFGFGQIEVAPGQKALVARPEKALIDLLYLTPGSDAREYLEELRMEWDAGFDVRTFLDMVERSGSRKVQRAAKRLRKLQQEKEEYTLV